MVNLSKLWGRQYENLCRVEIIGKNLEQNYRQLSRKIPVAPVLKSNAYGHGLALTAQVLDKLRPPFFCVDSLYEAYELLKAGVKTKILVMGYVPPTNLKVKLLPFSFAAYDRESLLAIHKYQPQAGIHLFVDTGMHREGVTMDKLPATVSEIKERGMKLEGLMSHPAKHGVQGADFRRAQKILATAGLSSRWQHMGYFGNVARIGLDLYLTKPALRLVTKIVQVKEIGRGEKVGYDWTFSAKKAMKLAILPIGYNEGVDRRLSNRGVVKIKGHFCPIIGRVSMNLTAIDVSRVRAVKVGDEVVAISDRPEDSNSVVNIAKACKTIPYEILVHLNPTLKRVLV